MDSSQSGERPRDSDGFEGITPGQRAAISTDSPIHRGTYESQILESDSRSIRLAAPMDGGRLVLVPVGTIVKLDVATPDGQRTYVARVVDRRSGADRSLVLEPFTRTVVTPHPTSPQPSSCQVYAVASGKGGVGKTVLVVNLAASLARTGKRVCIIDADLGTANVDVLLNLTPKYNLAHVVGSQKNIFEVLVEAPNGVIVLPGGSGFQELTALDDRQFERILSEFQLLEQYADIILIDTGAGLSKGVTGFLLAAQQGLIVTTPEPHAITDAYALIKVLARQGCDVPLHLVVNRTESEREAHEIAQKMVFASNRFLGFNLKPLGHILEDELVRKAIRRQSDFISLYPNAKAARCVDQIAARLLGERPPSEHRTGLATLLGRMKRILPRLASEI